jgi:alkylated DNA repair dioxygenase AlkB/tRNA A22 N-methylase
LELVVARQNVARGREAGDAAAANKVELRMGDGFEPVGIDERVDVVVVAGVGANTMSRILTAGGLALDGTRHDVKLLVLNPPAKDAATIRRWCSQNGWTTRDEALIVENGTMHLILSLVRGDVYELTLQDEIIGPILSQQTGTPLLTLYVKKRLEWVREIRRQSLQNLTRLRRDANADIAEIALFEADVTSYDAMESMLLEAIGLNAEEQKHRVEMQLKEQMARGFEGFLAEGEELKSGQLVYKTVDAGESDGRLGYCRQFLSDNEADDLLAQLISSPPIDWTQRSIVVWQPEENTTKEVMQPRLVSWAGELPYKYSGQTLEPVAMPSVLSELMHRVSKATGAEYNHILLNRYRDGYDSMALHADDEPELGRNANIAAISLGHTRRFDVQLKSKTKGKTSIFLENGSLMVMDGALQHTHYHGVPKNHTPVKGERINITFRFLRGPPGWRDDDDDDDD